MSLKSGNRGLVLPSIALAAVLVLVSLFILSSGNDAIEQAAVREKQLVREVEAPTHAHRQPYRLVNVSWGAVVDQPVAEPAEESEPIREPFVGLDVGFATR